MPRPRRTQQEAQQASTSPPAMLPETYDIVRVLKPAGNHLVSVSTASGDETLAEIPARLRGGFFVRRGGFVLIDKAALGERVNKIKGEIVSLCVGRAWTEMDYWPSEFKEAKNTPMANDESDEDGERGGQGKNVGLLPPSDDEN